jgi:hypothetical protein
MDHAAAATPCPASPTDPPPDRPAPTMPARIAALLHTVRVLLGFGRHLARTAEHRSASPSFNAIAACFGTSRLATILAHLQRGILRATALERVLLARAASGRDLTFVEPRVRSPAPPAAPPDPHAAQPADAPIARKAARPSRPRGWNNPELYMPTPQELEAQVRRRPLGRTLVDICLDLSVAPGFCTSQFWNELFDGIISHGGSLATLMREKFGRQEAFCKEQDRKPGSNWDWQAMGREAHRRVLGFFIGEVTGDSFDPVSEQYPAAAAMATGPP